MKKSKTTSELNDMTEDREFKEFLELLVSADQEEDQDPFDDNLPEPGTPLRNVMTENRILNAAQRKIYAKYNSVNIGCSPENPIVIREIEDYVHLEYELLEYILRPVPYRFVDYEVKEQALLVEGDKAIDRLTVEVSKHPLPSFDELVSGEEPPKEVLGTEDYYFDISAGFNALCNPEA